RGPVVRRERDVERAQAPGELLDGARPDDRRGHRRAAEQPGECHVGRRLTELATEPLPGLDLRATLLHPLPDPLARPASLARPRERAREQPARERAPGQETEAVGPAGRDHLELHGSRGEVVEALLGHEAEEVALGGDGVRLRDVPAGEVAAPDVDHLPRRHELLHRLPHLVPRRVAVDVMHLVEVDAVGTEAAEALVAGPTDVPRREAAVVRSVAHPPVDLGGEDHRLTTAGALADTAPDAR